MPLSFKDRVKQAVTTGGTGALVLGSARSGYQALGSGDNGLLFPYYIEDGTAWETGYGTYTHSGTSFARTVRKDSSTGSALTVSTSADFAIDAIAYAISRMSLAAQASPPGGRMTLVSGAPRSMADTSGATQIYYEPDVSDIIQLWDGVTWAATQFTSTSPGVFSGRAALSMWDRFGYLSGGALALEDVVWANSVVTISIATPAVVSWTTHGHAVGDAIALTSTGSLPTGLFTGARYFVSSVINANSFTINADNSTSQIATSGSQSGTHTAWSQSVRGTAVSLQDGRMCKTSDKTRLLLASYRMASSSTVADTTLQRFLCNMYNQIPKAIFTCPGYFDDNGVNSYQSSSSSWTPANGNSGAEIGYVVCNVGTAKIACTVCADPTPSASGVSAAIGDNSYSSARAEAPGAGSSRLIATFPAVVNKNAGFYTANLLILANGGTGTWYSDDARSGSKQDPYLTYLSGEVFV